MGSSAGDSLPRPGADDLQAEQIVEAIWLDQRRRWEQGTRIEAEEYFRRYPDLAQDSARAVDVVYHEYLLREEFGEAPQLDEYQQRFPTLAESLCRQVELHNAMDAAAGISQWTDSRDTARDAETFHRGAAAKDEIHWPGFPILGNYVVLNRIGRGGMGAVFRATHRRMSRIVALKVLSPSFEQESGAAQRFEREVQTAAQLVHPNIVTAYDADYAAGIHFLTMELVDGPDLERYVSLHGPLPVETAIELVLQAARGLQYAHEKGVIHRDIKPANLVLDAENRVRILDMGLASIGAGASSSTARDESAENENSSLTRVGHLVGTIDYMAPEQALNPSGVDPRCDVYSLGCTLHYLLCGAPVYAAESIDDKLAAHQNAPLPVLRAARPDVPASLDALFQAMIAKQPEQRPASMDEVVRRLEGIQRRAADLRRRRVVWSLGLAAAACLLAVVGWSWFGESWRRPDSATGIPTSPAVVAVSRPTGGDIAYVARSEDDGRAELAELRRQIEQGVGAEPGDLQAALVRANLARLRRDFFENPIGEEAQGLLDSLSWPCDVLAREQIPEYELQVAGEGDAANAPSEIVAILGDSRLRTWNVCYDVAFSPDRRTIAAGDAAMTVRLWDLETARLQRSLPTDGQIFALQFLPDGSQVAAAGFTGKIQFWDASNGTPTDSITAGSIAGLTAHDSGERIVSCGWDKKATVWDLQTKRPLFSLDGHEGIVWSTAYDPLGERIATAGLDHAVKVWRASTGEFQHTLSGHSSGVSAVAFSPDGEHVVSGGQDATVRVWDLATGKEKRRLAGTGQNTEDLCFVGEPAVLATAGLDRTVKLWNWETGELLQTLTGATNAIMAIAVSPDERTLAATGWDHSIQLWRLDTGESLSPNDNALGWLSGLAFSPDGSQLAASLWDGSVRVWSVPAQQPICTFQGHSRWVRSICYSSDGRLLAAAGDDGNVVVWNVATKEVHVKINDRRGEARCVAFRPDDRQLAVGYAAGAVVIYDAASGEPVRFLEGLGGAVHAVAYSPVGHVVAACDERGAVVQWSLRGGVEPTPYPRQGAEARCLAFSADGKSLIVGGGALWQAGYMRFFEADTRTATNSFDDFAHTVHATAISPDGKQLAVATWDGTVEVRDAQNGELVREFRIGPRNGIVWRVAFSPDGRHLATANGNGTIYVLRL